MSSAMRSRHSPVDNGRPIVLRYYEDLAEVDIADLLGCSVPAVKSLLHRASAGPAEGDRTMTMTDDELVERLRSTLRDWADEAPVSRFEASMVAGPSRTKAMWRRPTVRLWTVAAAVVAVTIAGAVVWVRHDPAERLVEVGSEPTTVTEIPIGRRYGVKGLAVTDDAVWVTSVFDEELYRIDPATDQVVATYPIPSHVEGVTAAAGWLWLSRYDPNEVVRVDPETGALTARLVFDSQPALVADGDALWAIADRDGGGRAFQIDPGTATVTAEIPLDGPPGFAAISGNSLWVAHHGTSLVSRVDIDQRRVSDVIDVGGEPRAVVATDGAVWVGVNGAGVEAAGWVRAHRPVDGACHGDDRDRPGYPLARRHGHGAVGDEPTRRHRVGHRHRHCRVGGHVTDRRHPRRAGGRPRLGVAGPAPRRRGVAHRSGDAAGSSVPTGHRPRSRRELRHDVPALLGSRQPDRRSGGGRIVRRRIVGARRGPPGAATPESAPPTVSASPTRTRPDGPVRPRRWPATSTRRWPRSANTVRS